jgi:hypothetical protein
MYDYLSIGIIPHDHALLCPGGEVHSSHDLEGAQTPDAYHTIIEDANQPLTVAREGTSNYPTVGGK